jgi:hypothetical protein
MSLLSENMTVQCVYKFSVIPANPYAVETSFVTPVSENSRKQTTPVLYVAIPDLESKGTVISALKSTIFKCIVPIERKVVIGRVIWGSWMFI